MKRWWTFDLRPRRGVMFLGVALIGVTGLTPGCALTYLARQGYYQGQLLAGRIPVSEALEREDVSSQQKERLRFVQEVRDFGEQVLRLHPTENYTTINLHFRQEIWNVSACEELAFKPHTWWFPVVGTVPYKGFFRKADAAAEARRLKDEGYETALRRVGGYSTLGWFKDPILPHMLEYGEGELANLVLHELAHATLFIPGRVDFNESFASFVGNEAALRFLAFRHGPDAGPLRELKARYADAERFNAFMHDLYNQLDEVYRSPLSAEEKREKKAAVLAAAPAAYARIPFESERYSARKIDDLNNADLLQYRRYSGARRQFARVLEALGGDMSRFFATFRTLEQSGEDPFEALARLAGTSQAQREVGF